MKKEIICLNPLEIEMNWLNSTKYMLKIITFDRKGKPKEKFKLMPGQEIKIPPKGYLVLFEN